MPKTTIDLDEALLEELKTLAARRRTSMSRLANRLLHEAVRRENEQNERPPPFEWHTVDGELAFDPGNRDYLDFLDEDEV